MQAGFYCCLIVNIAGKLNKYVVFPLYTFSFKHTTEAFFETLIVIS